jgi:TetR/AcrR family transcriptional repressor of mexJK operon
MDSWVASDKADGPSRGARKRAAILEAAQQVFFAHGFLGASMDQVAATAAVSKQTVYKHFRDKEALFREVVTNVVQARDGGIASDFLSTGDGPIGERLRSFARQFLKGVMQPNVLKLRRGDSQSSGNRFMTSDPSEQLSNWQSLSAKRLHGIQCL